MLLEKGQNILVKYCTDKVFQIYQKYTLVANTARERT